jgi:hypothetical protein
MPQPTAEIMSMLFDLTKFAKTRFLLTLAHINIRCVILYQYGETWVQPITLS